MTTPDRWAERDRALVAAFVERVRPLLAGTVRHIFDLGSRDCAEAVALAAAFPEATVHAFEANPAQWAACYGTANRFGDGRVRFVPAAVSHTDGYVDLYQADVLNSSSKDWPDGNPGASSLFPSAIEAAPTKVPSWRLDTYCREHDVERVDVVWADIQGAELLALQGLGDIPFDVLHTEVAHDPFYRGGVMHPELDAWLRGRGYGPLSAPRYSYGEEDLIYVHRRVLPISHGGAEGT